ncbi:hypothetical protein TRIP_D50056 [uncultured Paludibacter sp.]|uniref:Uncharacterized protein n=1 Tax=uncultured Paludibacter sp. TaxID=497635 RepID=A0A653AKR8_9BACT|nr:hypothetical protein TRIP_D50056 [uncultured Paludibacter sp.]
MKKIIKIVIILIPLLIIFLFVWMYFNPTIENKDFHMEYMVGSGKEDYHNYRNKNIENQNYTFNNYYCNDIGEKLVIYSLDIKKEKEKVIFVKENILSQKKPNRLLLIILIKMGNLIIFKFDLKKIQFLYMIYREIICFFMGKDVTNRG